MLLETENEVMRRNDDKKPGIGITNCRKRLELLYPGRYELAAGGNDGIYRVRLDIRIREWKIILNQYRHEQNVKMCGYRRWAYGIVDNRTVLS